MVNQCTVTELIDAKVAAEKAIAVAVCAAMRELRERTGVCPKSLSLEFSALHTTEGTCVDLVLTDVTIEMELKPTS